VFETRSKYRASIINRASEDKALDETVPTAIEKQGVREKAARLKRAFSVARHLLLFCESKPQLHQSQRTWRIKFKLIILKKLMYAAQILGLIRILIMHILLPRQQQTVSFNLKSILLIGLFFFSMSSYAEGTIITSSPDSDSFTQAAGFEPQEPWNSVVHFKNSTYVVWVDANYRAQVSQTTNGKTTTVPVDNLTDYIVQEDGHHFSIGVDKLGYLHIAGDMHNYTNGTTGVIHIYPARYQKQIILYWKSNKPEDVTGGFTFKGDNVATAMLGGGWLIGHFFSDNNGELFYTSQVHAWEGLDNRGHAAVGLYSYNTKTQSWATIGGIAPKIVPYQINRFPVFYWEDAGMLSGNFQNFQHAFRFDSKNHLHFAITSNTDISLAGANRILYAESDDGGSTWKRADGSAITGFPIRGISNLPSSADVVEETKVDPFYSPLVGVIADVNGKVSVGVDRKWRTWDGKVWGVTSPINFKNGPSPNLGYRLANNSILFSSVSPSKLYIAADIDSPAYAFDFQGYNEVTPLDNFSLGGGTLYGIGIKTDKSEAVVKTTIVAAPLPTGWSTIDIDATTGGFSGNAGYLDGTYVLTSYGVKIGENNDSFTYGGVSRSLRPAATWSLYVQ
jgi:hypothetical protein